MERHPGPIWGGWWLWEPPVGVEPEAPPEEILSIVRECAMPPITGQKIEC
jgi:hypothetical protein